MALLRTSFLSPHLLIWLLQIAIRCQSLKERSRCLPKFGNNKPAAVERAVPELPISQQNLKVQAVARGAGKTVTVISGFQAKPENFNLLKQLKTQCGTGGTVGKDTIEIQGDHTQKLVQLLDQTTKSLVAELPLLYLVI